MDLNPLALFYSNPIAITRGLSLLFVEVWVVLRLLSPGSQGTVLEDLFLVALKPRAEAACMELKAKTDGGVKKAGVEIVWGTDPETPPSAESMRGLESTSEGKQFYVLWLKDRYAYNIARLNEAYGLEAAAFTDLVESDFRSLDLKRSAVRADDADFAKILSDTAMQRAIQLVHACSGGAKLRWKPGAPESTALAESPPALQRVFVKRLHGQLIQQGKVFSAGPKDIDRLGRVPGVLRLGTMLHHWRSYRRVDELLDRPKLGPPTVRSAVQRIDQSQIARWGFNIHNVFEIVIAMQELAVKL